MNYAMVMLVPSTFANTSHEARETALFYMDTGIIDKKLTKRYSDNETNWYDSCRVGGLWSGYFSMQFLRKDKLKAFANEVEQTHGWPVLRTVMNVDSTTEEKCKKALEIFLKYFPDFQGEPPFFRYEFSKFGCPDDALFIDDQHKYDILLHEYEGESIVANSIDGVKLFSLSGVEVYPENIIGSHWAVIIACHF